MKSMGIKHHVDPIFALPGRLSREQPTPSGGELLGGNGRHFAKRQSAAIGDARLSSCIEPAEDLNRCPESDRRRRSGPTR